MCIDITLIGNMFLGVMTKNQNKIRLKTKFGGDGCIDRTTNKKNGYLIVIIIIRN